MVNHTIHFWGDNLAVVQVVNSLTSHSSLVMDLVRHFTLNCLRLNILFMARHVPGVCNRVADTLSRWQMQRFQQLVPDTNPFPVRMPLDL